MNHSDSIAQFDDESWPIEMRRSQALFFASSAQLEAIDCILFGGPVTEYTPPPPPPRKPQPRKDRLLTMRKAAERLGVSRSTVWRMVTKGNLPYQLMPQGTKRIKESTIEAVLSGQL